MITVPEVSGIFRCFMENLTGILLESGLQDRRKSCASTSFGYEVADEAAEKEYE